MGQSAGSRHTLACVSDGPFVSIQFLSGTMLNDVMCHELATVVG